MDTPFKTPGASEANEPKLLKPQPAPASARSWVDHLRSWRRSIFQGATSSWRWLRNAVSNSDAGARIVEWYRTRSRRQLAVTGAILFGCIVLLFLATRLRPVRPLTEQDVVARWLDAQLAGGTGSEYAAPNMNGARMHFHAMRYWRIVANPQPGVYLLDIGSETPDGDIANGECRVVVAHAGKPARIA
jgi:hypothetical protein